MLFTHFGVSGPLVLSGSRSLVRHGFSGCRAAIDLKPGLDLEKLRRRIERDFKMYARRDLRNASLDLLPGRLVPVALRQAGLDPSMKAAQAGKAHALALAGALKSLPFTVKGARPIAEAIVTAGGVSTRDVLPSTMEARAVPGLYFCGEVLDVDAYTGGFNLTIAFSTGRLAGRSAAGALR
jgi:predicted Rossmann fold flavoprotein